MQGLKNPWTHFTFLANLPGPVNLPQRPPGTQRFLGFPLRTLRLNTIRPQTETYPVGPAALTIGGNCCNILKI